MNTKPKDIGERASKLSLAAKARKLKADPVEPKQQDQKQDHEHPDRPPSRQGKKAIGFFADPEASKQLRQLALEEDSSVQELLIEALNDLFQKYGMPPIAK